jgi:hypothetical protein
MKYLKLYETFINESYNADKTILDISNKNLKKFPKEFLPLPDSLQRLDCDYNNLVSLPTLPDSLQRLSCDKLFKEIPVRLFNKGLGFDFEDNEVKEYLEKRLDIHPEEVVDVPEKYKKYIPSHFGNDYGFYDN